MAEGQKNPEGGDIDKAEPAVLRERREAEEAKRKKATLQDLNDENDVAARAGYVYFKDSDLRWLRNEIVVHPTVLLSITDHYIRSAKDTNRRVVGILLGEMQGPVLHITNTFGVPFEEDAKDSQVWYLDHSYLEKMFRMFKKINAREQIAGWYSTGATIREADIDIHELVRNYCPQPLYLLVDALNKSATKIPIQTYYSFEQPSNEERFRRSFVHTSYSIGATEAEEVGVEHLLRDIQASSTSTLGSTIQDKAAALRHMVDKLDHIADYLQDVADGKMPVRPHLMTQFQRLLNSLPDKTNAQEVAEAFQLKTNDALLTTYVAFATRLVLQVHELVRLKLAKQMELDAATQPATNKKTDGDEKEKDKPATTDADMGDQPSSSKKAGEKEKTDESDKIS